MDSRIAGLATHTQVVATAMPTSRAGKMNPGLLEGHTILAVKGDTRASPPPHGTEYPDGRQGNYTPATASLVRRDGCRGLDTLTTIGKIRGDKKSPAKRGLNQR